MIPCLLCTTGQDRLLLIHERGVPHGSPGHDTVYDHSRILACQGCGEGEIRSFSHDCWAPPREEDWDMFFSGRIGSEFLARVREAVASCPAPAEPECPCPVHEHLRPQPERAGAIPGLTRIPDRGAPKNERVSLAVRITDAGLPEFIRR